MAAVVRSRFFAIIALALAAIIVAGFTRTFYLRAFFELPPLTTLVHLHGIVFSAWLVLFVVQTQLIAHHNYRLHQKLGIAGVMLAALVVVVGVATALIAAPDPRMRPMGFTGQQFLIFPLSGIVIFAVCVAAAITLRKRSALHKRLMVLGMIAVLGPPVARLIRLGELGDHFLVVQTSVTAAFVLWALLHDWFKNRIVHPVFAIGGAIVVLVWPLRAAIARTDTWVAMAGWLTG
jgi:hypothetical protein